MTKKIKQLWLPLRQLLPPTLYLSHYPINKQTKKAAWKFQAAFQEDFEGTLSPPQEFVMKKTNHRSHDDSDDDCSRNGKQLRQSDI